MLALNSVLIPVVISSKWLLAGKIVAIIGTGLLTAAPAIEKMRKKKHC